MLEVSTLSKTCLGIAYPVLPIKSEMGLLEHVAQDTQSLYYKNNRIIILQQNIMRISRD